MRVYVNRTLPCFSYIVLLACLREVGHSDGAPFGTHVLNGKGLKINVTISDLFPFKLNHGNVCHEMKCCVNQTLCSRYTLPWTLTGMQKESYNLCVECKYCLGHVLTPLIPTVSLLDN